MRALRRTSSLWRTLDRQRETSPRGSGAVKRPRSRSCPQEAFRARYCARPRDRSTRRTKLRGRRDTSDDSREQRKNDSRRYRATRRRPQSSRGRGGRDACMDSRSPSPKRRRDRRTLSLEEHMRPRTERSPTTYQEGAVFAPKKPGQQASLPHQPTQTADPAPTGSKTPPPTPQTNPQSSTTDCTPATALEDPLRQVMTMLPKLGEPLRAAVSGTKFAECIPQAWYQVSLDTIYTHKSRAFAKRLYLEEPSVLFHFALAYLNTLCRDPKITTGAIRGLFRSKYGINSQRVLHVLHKETLHSVTQAPEVLRSRDAYGCVVDLTTISKVSKARNTVSDFQEPNSRGEVRRTDALIGPYELPGVFPPAPIRKAAGPPQPVQVPGPLGSHVVVEDRGAHDGSRQQHEGLPALEPVVLTP